MNRLTNSDRCRVLACLVEGNSIRATVRITGIAKKTVQRLGVELGEACEKFADRMIRDIDRDERKRRQKQLGKLFVKYGVTEAGAK